MGITSVDIRKQYNLTKNYWTSNRYDSDTSVCIDLDNKSFGAASPGSTEPIRLSTTF